MNFKANTKLKIITLSILFVIIIVSVYISFNKKNTEDNFVSKDIQTVSDFYDVVDGETLPLTDLPSDYSLYDAIDDGCFRLFAKIYNEQAYNDFMNAYEKKEKAFIRIVKTTDEGDIILFDVAYIPDKDKVYVVTDSTRAIHSSYVDKSINVKEYEKIGIYQKGSNSYIVAYTGELTEQNEDHILILSYAV